MTDLIGAIFLFFFFSLFLTVHNSGTEDKEENLQIKRTRCICLIDSSNKLGDILKSNTSFHVVAFVCPLKRYTSERKRFLAKIVSKFDRSSLKSFFLIITQCSEKHQAESIEEEVKNVSKLDSNLQKISNGYLVCPNADPDQDFELCQQFRQQFKDKCDAIHSSTPLKTIKSWKQSWKHSWSH